MKKEISQRRRAKQSGQEFLEFGLVALLLIPLLLGSIVTGLGLIKSSQANHICRDMANMYILGGDFSTYNMQQLAQRLATGMNLQIGSSFAGNNRANTGNGGDGLVTVSQIMWIGGTTGAKCQGVLPATCTNASKFVFTQRLQFGNGSLTWPNSLGNPAPSSISSSGLIANFVTDSGAQVPSAGQASMVALWNSGANGTAPLADGQVAYVVEVYFQTPSLSFGIYQNPGVYSRWFF